MKRKFLQNKIKPLICKKRSKKSKKNRITYAYEKNISTLLKNMKITEVSDTEYSSPEKFGPPSIFTVGSSVRDKFLKCNLRTYSSYTSSKSLNIYKKSEDKCIRFISIDTYLQGKVSCTPNSRTFEMNRLPPLTAKGKKYVTLHEPKPLLEIHKMFKLGSIKHNLQNGKFGKIPNFQLKSMNSAFKYEEGGMMKVVEHEAESSTLCFLLKDTLATSHFSCKLSDNMKKIMISEYLNSYITLRISDERLYFSYCKNLFHLPTITPREKFVLLPTVNDYSNGSKTCCHLFKSSRTKSVNNFAKVISREDLENIKGTIMELLWLDLKIEGYLSIFRQCNYESLSLKDIQNMKLKSARLVMQYNNLLLDKSCQSEYICDQVKKHSDQREKCSYYACRVNTNLSNVSTPKKIYSKTKRNCKRKRKGKDIPTPKRSKLLDDCIKRANAPKCFPSKSKNLSIIGSENEQSRNCGNNKKSFVKEKSKSTDDTSKHSNLVKNIYSPKTAFPIDPIDEEINKILLNLPPLEEALKTADTLEKKSVDFGNLTEIIHYDMGDGRTMVLLPYIDI